MSVSLEYFQLCSAQTGELERPTVRIVSFQEILVGKRMALHPAILWKLVNVRTHLARGETKSKPSSSERNHT